MSSEEVEIAFEIRDVTSAESSTTEQKRSYRAQLLVAGLFLLALSLGVRLYEISTLAPMQDEILWRRRAHLLNNMINDGNLEQATTHLRHPGIPPAIVLAIGERLGEKYNKYFGFEIKDSSYVDAITAMRATSAIVSSIAPVLLFYLVVWIIGLGPSFCAALIMALEPNVISLARIVHLDGVYPLLIISCAMSFFYAVERRSIPLKILSGLLWGLCIATKLTAVSLIPLFFLYKVLRGYIIPSSDDDGERSWITWGDLWAILLGQVVLASLFTKLWVHKGEELGRYAVDVSVADALYSLGLWEASHPSSIFASLISFLGFSWLAFRNRRQGEKSIGYHILMLASVSSFLMFTIGRFPIVAENLVRFWTFTSSLSHEVHENWGLWKSPQWGYLEILGRKLPSLVLFLYLFGFSVAVVGFAMRKKLEQRKAFSLLIFSALAPIVWCLPLNFPDKQTYRYAVPIFGLLCLCSGMALWIVLKYISKKLNMKSPKLVINAGILTFGIYLAFVAKVLHPHYYLSFNYLSGGIAEAKERKLKYHFPGHNEVIEFLSKLAIERNSSTLQVRILGDAHEHFSETHKHLYPHKRSKLVFRKSLAAEEIDFLVLMGIFPEHIQLIESVFPDHESFVLFRHEHQGVEMLRVYEIPFPEYKKPYMIKPKDLLGHVGRVRRFIGTKLLLERNRNEGVTLARIVDPKTDSKGFAAFAIPARVAKGTFVSNFSMAFPAGYSPQVAKPVAKIFNGHCERLVWPKELSSERFRKISLPCEISASGKAKLSAYWFGGHPLLINSISLERANQDTLRGKADLPILSSSLKDEVRS